MVLIAMALIAMALIAMALIAMAFIVMALYSYGPLQLWPVQTAWWMIDPSKWMSSFAAGEQAHHAHTGHTPHPYVHACAGTQAQAHISYGISITEYQLWHISYGAGTQEWAHISYGILGKAYQLWHISYGAGTQAWAHISYGILVMAQAHKHGRMRA